MQTSAGFLQKLKARIEERDMFFWGLWTAAIAGWRLLDTRLAHGPSSGVVLVALGVILAALAMQEACLNRNDKPGENRFRWRWFLLFLLPMAPLIYFQEKDWTPLAAGVILAVTAWGFARSRHRSWPIAVTGCLVTGAAVLLVPWPNEQRLMLVFVGQGAAIALQSAWEIAHYPQGQRTEPGSQPAASE
jgi:hypothetical protein